MAIFTPNIDENYVYNENGNLTIYDLDHYFNINSDIPIFESYMEYRKILTESVDKDSGLGNILSPVFIVLLQSGSLFSKIGDRVAKHTEFGPQKYWHAGISFGPSLNRIYSFNFLNEGNVNKRKNGLCFESLEGYKKFNIDAKLQVSCIVLGKDKYDQLKATLKYYIDNKEKTKYDFANLVKMIFSKATPDGTKFNLVCSTFVDTILRSVDIKISNTSNINLTKPNDLRAMRRNEKQFKIYEGIIKNYNIDKATKMVDKITSDVNNNYFKDTEKDDKDKDNEK